MSANQNISSRQQCLTPRQVQLLSTIADFHSSRGYSPTIGELAGRLGISRTTAFEHIEQLRKKELVSHQSRARSLTPTARAQKLLKQIAIEPSQESNDGIPLAGIVAAGRPIEAIENKDCLSLNSLFDNTDNVFALEVRGDSMIDAGITNGDYVICKRATTADDGQVVVAIVDNDNATLKRFYKEQTRVRLQPENDAYEPIYSDNCRIEGVVIGLIRKL